MGVKFEGMVRGKGWRPVTTMTGILEGQKGPERMLFIKKWDKTYIKYTNVKWIGQCIFTYGYFL